MIRENLKDGQISSTFVYIISWPRCAQLTCVNLRAGSCCPPCCQEERTLVFPGTQNLSSHIKVLVLSLSGNSKYWQHNYYKSIKFEYSLHKYCKSRRKYGMSCPNMKQWYKEYLKEARILTRMQKEVLGCTKIPLMLLRLNDWIRFWSFLKSAVNQQQAYRTNIYNVITLLTLWNGQSLVKKNICAQHISI